MEQLTVHVLSDDNEVIKVCKDYWARSDLGKWEKTVAEIADSYGVPSYKIPQIVKDCSYVEDNNSLCRSCFLPRIVKVRSEVSLSTIGAGLNKSKYFLCAKCLDAERAKKEKEKAAAQALRNERIEDYLSDLEQEVKSIQENATSVSILPSYYCMVLLALIKHSGDENLERIEPIEKNSVDMLFPSESMALDVLEDLQEIELIAKSHCSPHASLSVTDEGKRSYYPFKVAWELGVCTPQSEKVDIPASYSWLNCHVSSKEFRQSSWGGITSLAKKVVLEEALVYLNLELERRNFPEREGEKTIATLKEALDHFSFSQVCWIISNQLKHVSDRHRQGQSYGLPHASNQVISGISRYVERAIANSWDVTRFKRDYEQSQSVVLRVIFNLILKTDDGGFHYNLNKLFSQYDEHKVYLGALEASKDLDIPF